MFSNLQETTEENGLIIRNAPDFFMGCIRFESLLGYKIPN